MPDPEPPFRPGDKRFSHSYAVWVPCKAEPGEDRLVWRVDPPVGLDPARNDDGVREQWDRLGPDLVRADVIAVDDANLGFRHCSSSALWREVSAAGRNPWVLLKAARRVAEGRLFEDLREHCSGQLIVLMTIDDLRGTAVQISRELSWERTAQDVYWALGHHPSVKRLSQCAHVIVSFGAAGAVLFSRLPGKDQGDRLQCRLLFDPKVMEGTWEADRQGGMIGATACMAASLVSELTLAGDHPDLERAIDSGVAACRRLWREGYGDPNDPDRGMDVAFPLDRVVDALTNSDPLLTSVEVRDPTPFRSPRAPVAQRSNVSATRYGAAAEAPSDLARPWTILEDRYGNDLRAVAADVAVHGPDKALQGVPFGQFGELLTVDRSEIESFRSVRAVIAEYTRSSQPRPLSIAVFGSPGSGKSFGIVQVAQSVDPRQIGDKIEFNLSQFTAIEDLYDAFHRVRDLGLERKMSLVFWDEFDATFQNDELGWLRYFLAPMQDGAFRQGQIVHPIGRAIFVFAGGTSSRMERFGKDDEAMFRNQKGPDFMSRLKGYVDILGPNPREGQSDGHHLIRRAILLRSMLKRGHRQLFKKGDVLDIDEGVLRAFLQTKSYHHGARSLESIVATSRISGETSYERSSLPSEAQLQMHVDAHEFLSLVELET
jgi:hypothetical protein